MNQGALGLYLRVFCKKIINVLFNTCDVDVLFNILVEFLTRQGSSDSCNCYCNIILSGRNVTGKLYIGKLTMYNICRVQMSSQEGFGNNQQTLIWKKIVQFTEKANTFHCCAIYVHIYVPRIQFQFEVVLRFCFNN